MNFISTIYREVRRIVHRPRYLLLLTLALVINYAFFLTLMDEGQPQGLPIAIVDHDGTYLSRRLAHEIDATQGVSVVAVYDNHAEARKAMQQQRVYAFLEIPEGTYSNVLDFRAPHMVLYSNNAYLMAGSLSYKSLSTISKMAAGAVQREVLRKKGYDESTIMGAIQPIEIDAHFISNPTANYGPYILPTLLQGILGVLVLLLTVYEIRRERKEGTEDEWMASAGGNLLAALLGKLLPYTLYFFLIGTLGNIVMFGFFHYTLMGSFLMLTLMLLLFILAQQFMAVFLSGVLPQMHIAVCISAIYGMLSFTMAGFSYPVSSMPPFIQGCSYLFPLRQYYLAYVDIALYGCGFAYLWQRVAMLLVYVLLGFVGSILLFREYRTPGVGENTPQFQPAPAIPAPKRQLRGRQSILDFLTNVWSVFVFEVRRVFSDGGVLLLFFVASLLYPLIFSAIYKNECIRNLPVAVVDESRSIESRRMIHKLDATPELMVDYHCTTLAEAEHLMKNHAVRGVLYFPRDYTSRLVTGETARIGLFCDMSSFLYYRSVYTAAQMVMLDEMKHIELVRYNAAGLTGIAAENQVTPVGYDDVKLFCPAGGFTSFLVPALLVLVVFQTFFLGVCILMGTVNERRFSGLNVVDDFDASDSLLARLHRHSVHRIVIGRSLTYLMLYIPVVAIDLILLPRLFGLPHIGRLGDILLFLLPFLLASIGFFLTVATFVRERDSGVLVFISFSLLLVFSSGIIWPQCGMPPFLRGLSWIFPSTHGIQGFVRINSMGARLPQVQFEYTMLWIEAMVYFLTACAAERYHQEQANIQARLRHRVEQLRRQVIAAKNRALAE